MTTISTSNIDFHDTIKTCSLPIVKEALMKDKSALNTLDTKVGWPPIYKAVVYEQKEILEFLLIQGADPNISNRVNFEIIFKSKIGETALHYAVESGYVPYVKLLLRYGADPNLKQSDGDNSIHIACKKANFEILEMLLQAKNPDINAQNKLGKTALHIAGDLSITEIYAMLIAHGADPSITDKWKRKPKTVNIEGKEYKLENRPLKREPIEKSKVSEYIKIDSNFNLDDNKENVDPKKPLGLTKGKDDTEKPQILKEKILSELDNPEDIENIKPIVSNHQEKKVTKIFKEEKEKRVLADITKPIMNQIFDTFVPREQVREIPFEEIPQDTTNKAETSSESLNNGKLKTLRFKKIGQKISEAVVEDLPRLLIQKPVEKQPEKSTEDFKFDPRDFQEPTPRQEFFLSNASMMSPPIKENLNFQASPIIHFTPEAYRDMKPTPIITPRDQGGFASPGLNNNLLNIFCHHSAKNSQESELKPRATDETLDQPENIKTETVEQFELVTPMKGESTLLMEEALAEIRLIDLRANFHDNGYYHFQKFIKDYSFCEVVEQDLMFRFGIDKPGNRIRIIMMLKEAMGQFDKTGLFTYNKFYRNTRELAYPNLEEWLSCMEYEEYYDLFVDNGYDDMEYLILQVGFKFKPLTEFILQEEIGISDPLVRKELMKKLKSIYEVASQMMPYDYEPKKFMDLLSVKEGVSICKLF